MARRVLLRKLFAIRSALSPFRRPRHRRWPFLGRENYPQASNFESFVFSGHPYGLDGWVGVRNRLRGPRCATLGRAKEDPRSRTSIQQSATSLEAVHCSLWGGLFFSLYLWFQPPELTAAEFCAMLWNILEGFFGQCVHLCDLSFLFSFQTLVSISEGCRLFATSPC
ncbi:hypothetical protein BS47DRAFT_888487 [Hydnum rufescens UP504]|uniref:Uncharacterized protein n=1 Tax=Hydnum rufescens UP504 TaxID=1448309 RepID=A0A9P6AYI6_9AGAM|nr:hypothetical protein BS47DRAFT_888487 [Hydnum rufescens UP504]